MRFISTTLNYCATLLVVGLIGLETESVAQPANNSPYARYGLGNLSNGVNVRSAGLGGISVAMREDSIPFLVNFVNPASYTSIGFTAFDVGVYGNVATISSAQSSQEVNQANLSYFAFGFPVLKWWGGAFGLRQFSSVNYTVSELRLGSDSLFGDVNYRFQGDGGINQFFIGIGVEPFRNFSIGLNASYLFGKLNRIQRLEYENENFFNVRSDRYTQVGGFYVDYGLQYSLNLKGGKHGLVFGATFAHPMKVRANDVSLARTYTLTTFGEDLFRDTVLFDEVKGGRITMPWKYGAGVTWKAGEKWLLGVEHTQELWSTFRNVNGKNDSLADAWRTSVGLEFKPSVPETNRGIWAYFGKMHYRLGGHYSMTQYSLNGVQLPNYGITLGFGFPMRKTRAGSNSFVQSMINVSVEWGQRGTTDRNLLLENYWNFKLGFTLNDRWFIKRKYD